MMSNQGYQASPGMSVTVRPMTEAERQVVKSIPKPQRNNAIGISIVAMVMAVMVNFVEDQVALLMPIFFSFVGLGLAIQARKSSGSVGQALAKGVVTEVRATPRWKGAGGWEFGTLSVPRSKQLEGKLVDGVFASVAIVPEAKRLVSVNMTPVKGSVTLTVPPGFGGAYAAPAVMQPPVQMPTAAGQDLPPPPEGWAQGTCPRCGQSIAGDMMFCDKCGFRLKP